METFNELNEIKDKLVKLIIGDTLFMAFIADLRTIKQGKLLKSLLFLT